MKKLIALFAVSAVASTSAIAGVALSGSASVSYDDNGSAKSATKYDADMVITGTAGSTTLTAGYDMEGTALSTTSTSLSTKIGPITVTADMHDELSVATSVTVSGGQQFEKVDTGVTISLDAPIGDATIGLDNSGNVSVSGTWAGVTISHTIKDGSDTTTGAASIAGMDVSVTNDGGSSTWSIGTTVSGVALTLASSNKITAAFGLAGNTMTVSHIPKVSAAVAKVGLATGVGTNGYGTLAVASAKAYSTVAISRDLTSGATLAATYDTSNESLTLKASVAF